MTDDVIIEVKNVSVKLGNASIHHNLNLEVKRGEILAIVGGSGSGKTTLLREMLMLQKIDSGTIKVFGKDLAKLSPHELLAIQRRWGVLFQHSALFSSLTLLENTAFPLVEHTDLDKTTRDELSLLKILLTGLPVNSAVKYPSELSGGMQKRGGLARALVMDPELLFLDEPTSGLDPEGAGAFDQLVLDLQASMNLTIVLVTHDVDSLWRVANRVAFLGEGKVLCVDTMKNLVKNSHPMIQAFFAGPRGRITKELYDHK